LTQAIHTYKTKNSDDLSEMFLWFWGEVFTLAYIFYGDYMKGIYHFPL